MSPAAGRLLNPGDDRAPGEPNVVVLSHRYWTRRFAANPGVLNDTLIVNGRPFTIVGVGPEGFDGTTIGSRPQFYVPMSMTDTLQPGNLVLDNRRAYWIYLFARLKPGVGIEEAQTAINVPYHSIINEVEVPLQKGMSDATLGRFKTKVVEVTAGARGQSSTPEEAFVPLSPAVRDVHRSPQRARILQACCSRKPLDGPA